LAARSSGVLLHPTSLPSGRLGSDAYDFVDWLADAGQSWWQILPLGPPDAFGSPYTSASAFAAWRELLAAPTSAPIPTSSSTATSPGLRPTSPIRKGSCGASTSTTGGACARRATGGGSSASGGRSSSSISHGSTISA